MSRCQQDRRSQLRLVTRVLFCISCLQIPKSAAEMAHEWKTATNSRLIRRLRGSRFEEPTTLQRPSMTMALLCSIWSLRS